MQRQFPLSPPAIPNISKVDSIALILSNVHSQSEVVDILVEVLRRKYYLGGAYKVAKAILERAGEP